jgi:hypothetical protein
MVEVVVDVVEVVVVVVVLVLVVVVVVVGVFTVKDPPPRLTLLFWQSTMMQSRL